MFEVIVVTPDEARVAEAGGADRLELVSALSEGGLTPGIGLLRHTVAAVRIPVNVMVRPHSRGFCYRESEIAVMAEEVRAARDAGAHGVVFGVLDEQRRVHERHLEWLLACAEGMEVTFHRAIDASEDPLAAVALLSRHAGLRTVLTSGGPGPIEANTGVLAAMREVAGSLRIMAGGGLTFANAIRVLQKGRAQDAHFGAAVRWEGRVDGTLDPGALAALKALLVRGGLS